MNLSKNVLDWVRAVAWLVITLLILGFGVWILTVDSVQVFHRVMTALVCLLISGGFFFFFSIKDFKALIK